MSSYVIAKIIYYEDIYYCKNYPDKRPRQVQLPSEQDIFKSRLENLGWSDVPQYLLRHGPLKVQTLPTLAKFETIWETERKASGF